MSGHFAAKYPENGLHERVVEAIVVEGRRLSAEPGADASVRVLNQAASQGTFGALLQTAWAAASAAGGALPPLDLHQSDIIVYAPGGVCGVDDANRPLDAAGARLDAGSVHVAFAGCCWYNGQASFNLVANGVVTIARRGALMLFGATRRQFVSLAPSLQAFVLSGMVEIESIENVKLNPAHGDPDAFFIRARKRDQTAPLLEGGALYEAIFVGQLRPAVRVEEARLGASLPLRGHIQAVIDLHGPLCQAVKLGLAREAAMLLCNDAIGVSAQVEVALGLAAAASLLLPNAPALASVFKLLEPLIEATGASAHFCMLASGARPGYVAAMTLLAGERRAALEPLGGIDVVVGALDAAGRGVEILPEATLRGIIAACSISPGARPVLAVGEDTHARGHQGVYGIPGTTANPECQRVGISLGDAVTRMEESYNHVHGALLLILPHELAGKGGGGAVADSSDNYVKTFAAQAVEVLATMLYMGGLIFRQMWGNQNTVYNSIDVSAWGGAATGLLRAAAAAELHAMVADGRGAEVDARLAISGARREKMRATAATARAGGAGRSAVSLATTQEFESLSPQMQSDMRISDSKDGGKIGGNIAQYYKLKDVPYTFFDNLIGIGLPPSTYERTTLSSSSTAVSTVKFKTGLLSGPAGEALMVLVDADSRITKSGHASDGGSSRALDDTGNSKKGPAAKDGSGGRPTLPALAMCACSASCGVPLGGITVSPGDGGTSIRLADCKNKYRTWAGYTLSLVFRRYASVPWTPVGQGMSAEEIDFRASVKKYAML